MKRRITLLLMFFLTYASGCAAPPKMEVTPGPKPYARVQTAPLLSTHTIDKKISVLEGIVAKKTCRKRTEEWPQIFWLLTD